MNDVQQKLQAAMAKHGAGDIPGAAVLYRSVLAEEPEQPDALHMLGIIAQQAGNSGLALKLIEAALAKKPEFALAWHNRCLVLRALGRPDDALQSAREALALDPGLADAWDMAGSILREKRQFGEACDYLERAVALKPHSSQILNSYIVLLTACGRFAEAWGAVRKMESIDDVSGFIGVGNLLKAAGYPARALPWFRKARDARPDFIGSWLNEAMAHFLMGEMEQGYPLWEKRLKDSEHKRMPAPLWKGEPVGHLLLTEDQGMGDALQCLRYIPLIRERADKITLRLTGFLKNLLEPNLPGISIITLDDPIPQADAAAQLMSLPMICGTRADTIPAPVPYIRAEESRLAPWRERLANLPSPRIGLVWGGNPDNRHDAARAMSFSQLAPIIDAGASHFVSLQKGAHRKPEELLAAGVFDADPYLKDFADTAGLIAELDLVITICSSPAHLAGAMGRPVWTMLCFDPHWIWLLGREDSPWYPSMRLFRQKAPGDWASVAEVVAEELRKFIGGDRSVLAPRRWAGVCLTQNPLAVALLD